MLKKLALLVLISALVAFTLVACGESEPEVVEVTRVVVEEVAGEPEVIEVTRVVEVEGETQTITEVVTATPEPAGRRPGYVGLGSPSIL